MTEEELLTREAQRQGISITQLRMRMAVPDSLMRDIVRDNRRANASQPTTPTPLRGNGWVDAPKLSQPPGVALLDRIMDAQDAIDRAERVKQFGGGGGGKV
jgi:hypothetical protein